MNGCNTNGSSVENCFSHVSRIAVCKLLWPGENDRPCMAHNLMRTVTQWKFWLSLDSALCYLAADKDSQAARV